MSKANDYSAAHLYTLPTIIQGHFDDLKIETPTERVWLSRLTNADGLKGSPITVEHKFEGGWK